MGVLAIRDLRVAYGRLRAVHGLNMEVGPRQIVAVLGANGAGKTSVLRAIAGSVSPASGTITFEGRLLHRMGAHRRAALGVATVPENRGLFPSLSVAENLMVGAYSRRNRGAVKTDLAWIYETFPALWEKRKARAATLSGGQAQMLALGRALMAQPRLLLLDEPSHGLAPILVDFMFSLLGRLIIERELAILLVEQNASKALTVASYGYVLEVGHLALQGPTSDLVKDETIQRLYLGG